LSLSIGVVFAAYVVPAVAAASPATLTGETLSSTGGPGGARCDRSGPFSYTASGTATGPFPGTFTETGTGTVNLATRTLSAFSAFFTIHSAAGTVTGTKGGSGGSVCQDTSGNTVGVLRGPYQAVISTPTGSYNDRGNANTTFGTGPSGTTLNESFTSSLTQPVLISTSKDQCKHGAWQNFGGTFKKQGDCVSFVATGGKNPPSG